MQRVHRATDHRHLVDATLEAMQTLAQTDFQWLRNELTARSQVQRFGPRQHVIEQGQPADFIYWIDEGLVRLCIQKYDGKEINKDFHREGMFSGSYACAIHGCNEAPFAMIALEPTLALAFPGKWLVTLARTHPTIEHLLRVALETMFFGKEWHENLLLSYRPQSRWDELLRDKPWLPQRVAQKYLASYLGVTEVSLSRLRARTRSTKS